MEDAALTALCARLRSRLSELEAEIRRDLQKSDNELYERIAGQVHDSGEDAFADLLVDINLAEVDRDLTELRAVHAALQRISRGTYGRCEDCGASIAVARLRAEPAASRCLSCQEHRETRSMTPHSTSL
ncbi:MAG: TraR/DksA family transcriptional regulator [Steroidobacteraceae bacterium]